MLETFKLPTFRNTVLGAYGLAAIGLLTGHALGAPLLAVAGTVLSLALFTFRLSLMAASAISFALDLATLAGTTDLQAARAMARQAWLSRNRPDSPTVH